MHFVEWQVFLFPDTNQLNVVILSFLASYWFFATGHQNTIPSIRFEAGFVGLQGDSSNHFITGKFNS